MLRAASESGMPIKVRGSLDMERSGMQPIYYLSEWGLELSDYSLGK